jgi:hypothetical protein
MHNRSELLAAMRSSHLLSVESWNSPCAVTLTLKQAESQSDFKIFGDWIQYSEAFRLFMKSLNRSTYKNAFRYYGKRLRVIPILEKSCSGRFHYHAAIDKPKHIKFTDFGQLIRDCWSRADWGYDRSLG